MKILMETDDNKQKQIEEIYDGINDYLRHL